VREAPEAAAGSNVFRLVNFNERQRELGIRGAVSCRWSRYGHRVPVNMRGELAVTVSIDGRACDAHCTYCWAGGGRVLTLSTVLPERLAVELISTYVGHAGTPTIATHLMLGPVGEPASIAAAEHAHDDLDPVESARECAYDHAHELVELLGAPGRRVTVQLEEHSFKHLELVE
jgi:hypothetical protein